MAIEDYPVSIQRPDTPVLIGYDVNDLKQPINMVGWEWKSLGAIEVSHYEVEIYDVSTGGSPLETRIVSSRESSGEIHRIFTIPERDNHGTDANDPAKLVPLDTKVIGSTPKPMYARVRAIHWSGQNGLWTERVKSETRRSRMLDREPLAYISKVLNVKQTFEAGRKMLFSTDTEYHTASEIAQVQMADNERGTHVIPIILTYFTTDQGSPEALLPSDGRFSAVKVGDWTVPPIQIRLGKITDTYIDFIVSFYVNMHGPTKQKDKHTIDFDLHYEYC